MIQIKTQNVEHFGASKSNTPCESHLIRNIKSNVRNAGDSRRQNVGGGGGAPTSGGRRRRRYEKTGGGGAASAARTSSLHYIFIRLLTA